MNEVGAIWAEAVFRATWQGLVGIGVVWLTCRLFRRIPNSLRCGLWWLVCLRMLIAFIPASIALPLLSPSAPESHLTSTFASEAASVPIPLSHLPTDRLEPTAAASPAEPLSIAAWLFLAWLAGTCVCGGVTLSSLIGTHSIARKAKVCEDPDLLRESCEIASRLGMRMRPRLLISEKRCDAMTIGAWRPVVLLSRETLERCSPEERRMILAHEFAHLRRRDGWLALVPQIARVIFFFHPAVWLASSEFDLAREADCDQTAIQALQVRSDRYARLLLKLGVRRHDEFTLCSPGVSSHFRVLRRRITMLQTLSDYSSARPRRSARALVGLVALLCAAPFSIVQGQAPEKPKAAIATPSAPPQPLAAAISKAPQLLPPKMAVNKKKAAVALPAPVPTRQAGSTAVEVFRLQHAKTASVMTLLQKLFPQKDVYFAPDAASNLIVVRGNKSVVGQVGRVVGKLDHEAGMQNGSQEDAYTRIYSLHFAQALEAVRILTASMPQKRRPIMVVDSRTNSVVATGTENQHMGMSNLLAQLDREATPTATMPTSVFVVKLKHAVAPLVLPSVIEMARDKDISYIRADAQSNSLVIQATDKKYQEFLAVVKQIDVPTPKPTPALPGF